MTKQVLWVSCIFVLGVGLSLYTNCRNLPLGTQGQSIQDQKDVDSSSEFKNAFVSVWETTESNESIMLPLKQGYQYDFIVDWGDDSEPQSIYSWNDPQKIHTYESPGQYTVQIKGLVEAWFFNFDIETEVPDNADKIVQIVDLGDVGWVDLSYAFARCSNLTNVQGGETKNVVNMEGMFMTANQVKPITTDWDTSNVTNMKDMFNEAQSANPNVAEWNTSNVTNMSGMFAETQMENPDVSKWNTSSVTDMSSMFLYASNANPDTSLWIVSQVNTMEAMFKNATSANPDVSNWQTSSLVNGAAMFENATLANPDFSNWNFNSVENLDFMMTGATAFSSFNYSHMLIQIAETFNMGSVPLGAHQTEYALFAQQARDTIIDEGWIISDAGLIE